MIKFENVTFKYDDRVILENLTFVIEEGKKYGLVGRNGAGKSTMIKLMLNLIRSQKGKITINNFSNQSRKWKPYVTYLPEKFTLYRQLTGYENLEFMASFSDHKFNKDKAYQALKIVDLFEDKDRMLNVYSKGMMQRLGLSTVVYNDSDIIILDEPTSGLDPLGRRDILNIIKEFQNKTILMSSHHIDEVKYTCDYVLVLEDKKIEQMTIEEYYDRFLEEEESVEKI